MSGVVWRLKSGLDPRFSVRNRQAIWSVLKFEASI
jgi:hypothetical protein